MKNFKTKKAFTLIEILLATAIFAVIMIMVVATFSMTASYNNRLRETRRVGQEVRMIMDNLTKDIRLANGSAKFRFGSSPPLSIVEVFIFRCLTASCNKSPAYDNPWRPPLIDIPVDNTLLILKKDEKKAILYRLEQVAGINHKLTRSEYTVPPNTWDENLILKMSDFSNPVILQPDDQTINIWTYFGGFSPSKVFRIQQPFVEIYIIGETYDYNLQNPNMRAKFHLRTTVETRDYNP